MNSKHKEQAVSKNTYYRFLNEASYNWSRFLMLLAVKVISAFDRLTRPERVNVLILDDSVVKRNRSKKVELLALVYDHVEHKFQKGFTLLTLGWSDGYSFIPTGFNLCCLQPLKATVIMKFQIALTTGQTAISFVNQV